VGVSLTRATRGRGERKTPSSQLCMCCRRGIAQVLCAPVAGSSAAAGIICARIHERFIQNSSRIHCGFIGVCSSGAATGWLIRRKNR
jgi:hypothetical protein